MLRNALPTHFQRFGNAKLVPLAAGDERIGLRSCARREK
jgi:hypothetical protein